MRQYLLGVLTGVLLGIAASSAWGMGAPQIYHKYKDTVVQVQTGGGMGTGVVVNRLGDVLTNAHVVDDAEDGIVIIPYPGEAFYTAKVIRIDKDKDLALLDIDSNRINWKYVKIQKTSLYIGQPVYSIGHPFGNTWSISDGIVSGERRFFYGSYRTQSTVVTNPGSSGSPLFDKRGRLVGLMQGSFKASPFGGYAGIALAVSIDDILEFMTIKSRYKIGDIK